MSYEAEKKRLIEEFESVVAGIRADYGLKDKKQTIDSRTSQPESPRATGRH
jgi:hypothetical protein